MRPLSARASLCMCLGLVLLSACGSSPKSWTKPGASEDQVERDRAQCEYEAKAATASYHSTPSKPGETAAVGRAVGDGIVIAEKQIELTRDCMRARGYSGR